MSYPRQSISTHRHPYLRSASRYLTLDLRGKLGKKLFQIYSICGYWRVVLRMNLGPRGLALTASSPCCITDGATRAGRECGNQRYEGELLFVSSPRS